MPDPSTVDEILDYAIAREVEAAEFYTRMAAEAKTAEMRQTFEQFAAEERGHRARLQAAKDGKKLAPAGGKIGDLSIADYAVDVEPDASLDYPKALILAMRREKAAFRLYSKLAERTVGDVRDLFLALAQEEARHKLRFEIEYDESVLIEN